MDHFRWEGSWYESIHDYDGVAEDDATDDGLSPLIPGDTVRWEADFDQGSNSTPYISGTVDVWLTFDTPVGACQLHDSVNLPPPTPTRTPTFTPSPTATVPATPTATPTPVPPTPTPTPTLQWGGGGG